MENSQIEDNRHLIIGVYPEQAEVDGDECRDCGQVKCVCEEDDMRDHYDEAMEAGGEF